MPSLPWGCKIIVDPPPYLFPLLASAVGVGKGCVRKGKTSRHLQYMCTLPSNPHQVSAGVSFGVCVPPSTLSAKPVPSLSVTTPPLPAAYILAIGPTTPVVALWGTRGGSHLVLTSFFCRATSTLQHLTWVLGGRQAYSKRYGEDGNQPCWHDTRSMKFLSRARIKVSVLGIVDVLYRSSGGMTPLNWIFYCLRFILSWDFIPV